MIDIKEIRENPAAFEKRLKSKDPTISIVPLLKLDEEVRALTTKVEELKALRNSQSKTIGEKKRAGEDVTKLMSEVSTLGDQISGCDAQLSSTLEKFQSAISSLPNPPDENAPISLDPSNNVLVSSWGEKPTFDFEAKHHLQLNEKLNLIDLETSAKLTGSGWPLYRGQGARLEWALLNFMIDTHTKNGYEFILPPLLARSEVLYGAGQLPKFADQLFQLNDNDYPLYLNPTSEVILNGMHSNEILDSQTLPRKYCAYTPCFRREAGAAGSGERGLIRMHQFNKVEMFCFTEPEQSDAIFNEMVHAAESILQALGLHYRVMQLVTGDMSFGGANCYDIEVWLPGQGRYYEVSSVSNCRDFQARRAKIRAKSGNEKPHLVHTLNGSGLATSRLFVALLENNQRADGTVALPTALHPYLGNMTELICNSR